MWQLLAKFQIILLHNGEDKINGKCEVKNFAARKKLVSVNSIKLTTLTASALS